MSDSSHQPTEPTQPAQPSSAPASSSAQASPTGRFLRPKDWISVGVFSVIYMILVYLFGMLGYVPFIYPFCGFLYGLFCQTPVLLMIARTQRFGAFTVLGLLTGLLVGFGVPLLIPVGLVGGLIADLIALSGRYIKRVALIVACGVFNIIYYTSYVLFFSNTDTLQQISQAYGQDYVDQVTSLLPTWFVVAMPIGLFAAGALGAMLALRVLNKHFRKAGLI